MLPLTRRYEVKALLLDLYGPFQSPQHTKNIPLFLTRYLLHTARVANKNGNAQTRFFLGLTLNVADLSLTVNVVVLPR